MEKTVDYYMSLRYKMILEPDAEEGGWTVSFPDLPGCVTCGETLNDALANAEDARRVWTEAMLTDGRPIADNVCAA